MKKVLVTGGAGFIGSHTVVALHEAGYAPVLVDDFSNSEPAVLDRLAELIGQRPAFHELDACDQAALEAVLAAEGPLDGAIHFAASKSVSESVRDPLKYYRNNLGSLTALLRAMETHQLTDLVFSSSCTVYGQPAELPVTEAAPLLPAESPYGRTKQICETILDDLVRAGEPLRAVLLRYFNPIGAHPSGKIGELPRGAPENLVPYITQTAAGIREQLTVFGDDYETPDGTCIRDYIHVMDLAEAHVRALEWLGRLDPGGRTEAFNVGTGRGVSVLEAIEAFERASGTPLNYVRGKRRPGDIVQVWADASKAEATLGWSARRGVDEAMRDAWTWQVQLGT